MLPDQFKTTRQNLSKGKTIAFMNIFGLLFGLFAFYAINEIKHDGFHPDATNILGHYEWYRAITGQTEDDKVSANATSDHRKTGAEIPVSNSTASSMDCTSSMLRRNVFLTSFKLVRRGLACKNERTCLN